MFCFSKVFGIVLFVIGTLVSLAGGFASAGELIASDLPQACNPANCASSCTTSLCKTNCAKELETFKSEFPLKVVSPASPGSSSDTMLRGLTKKLSLIFGGSAIVVENKPGANGLIAADSAKFDMEKSPMNVFYSAQGPDVTLLPYIEAKTAGHLKDAFEPLGYLGSTGYILVCNNSTTKAETMDGLEAYLKSDVKMTPTIVQRLKSLASKNAPILNRWMDLSVTEQKQHPTVLFGHGGTANFTAFLQAEYVRAAELDYTSDSEGVAAIGYKGTSPAWTDLKGGHIDCMFQSEGTAFSELTRNPRMFALGATKPGLKYKNSNGIMIEIPEVSAKYPNFPKELENWVGLFGKKDLVESIGNCMRAATSTVLNHESWQADLKRQSYHRKSGYLDTAEGLENFVELERKNMGGNVGMMIRYNQRRPFNDSPNRGAEKSSI